MPSVEQNAQLYQELANGYEHRKDGPMRDRFLVLAAASYLEAGNKAEAERLRGRLLQGNPHHLFKPYDSMSHAMQSTDVQNYVDGLRRHYPPETARQLLGSLDKAGRDKTPVAATPIPEDLRLAEPPNLADRPPASAQAEVVSRSDVLGGRPPKAPSAGPGIRSDRQARQDRTSRLRNRFGRRAPATETYALMPSSSPWGEEDGEPPPGAWFPAVLFWLLLIAGLCLVAWMGYGLFGRPSFAVLVPLERFSALRCRHWRLRVRVEGW